MSSLGNGKVPTIKAPPLTLTAWRGTAEEEGVPGAGVTTGSHIDQGSEVGFPWGMITMAAVAGVGAFFLLKG